MRLVLLTLLAITAFSCNAALIPPPAGKVARMARYVIKTVDWVSVATTSTQSEFSGYAFANLKSISDGPPDNCTGTPYFYMSNLDFTGQDLKENNNCSIMATLAETDYCRSQKWDPQDPRCARIIMTGKIVKVDEDTKEHAFAKDALIKKHPEMKYWPLDHEFYVAKMNLEFIGVLDMFGGIRRVSVEDYYNAKPNGSINSHIDKVFVIILDDDEN